jgi:hypothetical protein
MVSLIRRCLLEGTLAISQNKSAIIQQAAVLCNADISAFQSFF